MRLSGVNNILPCKVETGNRGECEKRNHVYTFIGLRTATDVPLGMEHSRWIGSSIFPSTSKANRRPTKASTGQMDPGVGLLNDACRTSYIVYKPFVSDPKIHLARHPESVKRP